MNLMKVLRDYMQSLFPNGHVAKCLEMRYIKAADILVATQHLNLPGLFLLESNIA